MRHGDTHDLGPTDCIKRGGDDGRRDGEDVRLHKMVTMSAVPALHRPTGTKQKNRTWTSYALLGFVSVALSVAWILPAHPSVTLNRVLAGSGYADLAARFFHLQDRDELVSSPAAVDTELLSSNNRTDQVQWDGYSLLLRGQRVFILSGEFHTFRLPVPSLWPDILQKVKAAGLNAISLYTHWGLINPSPGVIDFDAYRALQPIYEAARAAGVWIILRPGPYINAETTAGGIAHWATSQVAGQLRTNATDFHASWQDYIQGIIKETVPYQITQGGPVIAIQIDNEYEQSGFGDAEYFAELEAAYHNSSIVVSLTYNDPGEGKNFINGTGAVDIYGLDSYPQGFDCSNPTRWAPVPTNWHDYHEDANPSQPFYFPEFQGGAFDAWGPTAPGYENCRELTGADFESVFYRSQWAANAKLISYYMVYGGTSWGALPFGGVYTSYDYGSAIQENRDLTDKYTELKRQGLFLRSSPEFYKTNWIGNSSTGAVNISNSAAFAVLLRNPDTNASFYIARQTDSTSTATTTFTLTLDTSAGTIKVPQIASNITLGGRESKVIVSDYHFGENSTLLYSTASVLLAGRIGSRDVVFLFGDASQEHEASLILQGPASIRAQSSLVSFSNTTGPQTVVTFLPGIEGLVTVFDSLTQLVLFADAATAGTFWAPVLPADSSAPLGAFWGLGSNATLLVGGPHLVRNASLSGGGTLALRGDINATTRLVLVGPPGVRRVTWNGEDVAPDTNAVGGLTSVGGFVGQLEPARGVQGLKVPALTGWKFKDSLPEVEDGFDDSAWVLANHTTTNIPFKPYYGDGRVLYGCDYGFCENVVLWRGHFNATGNEKSVNLSINGGEAFAASVWLNSHFLNTSFGNSTNNRNILEETDDKFTFPAGALTSGQNVITIVQDNMGLNESGSTTNTPKSPRGVRGFKLDTGNFSDWRVQGKVGGYTDFPDKTRGVFNEGGLFGERQGWHLPGFDTSSWQERDLSSGLPNNTAGIGFFVATFELDIEKGLDVMLSFTFGEGGAQPYRAFLFVNGWMMGKRVGNLGPQTKFPVHEGILDYNGENTVAVALWAMEPVAVTPKLDLTVDTVLDGGVEGVVTNNPRWSSEGRS